MHPQAIFFGAIGVLAETSDIQRRAYNRALSDAGLDWQWDVETYKKLLQSSGGMARLRRVSHDRGAPLSDGVVAQIHARKTAIACAEIRDRRIGLRPGVAALVARALAANIPLALVTTTFRENIDAIADAAGEALPLERFAAVMTVTDVTHPKPAPDVYIEVLRRLHLVAADVVAIEDTQTSITAAKGAGIRVICTPGEFVGDQDLSAADALYPSLADVPHDILV